MSVSKSEADVIFNRANVALARSQRLVASWLPAKTADEIVYAKSEEELQREEDEIFTPVPEKLGLGAPLPKGAADGSWNRTELNFNDKLRRQLLGENYSKAILNPSYLQPQQSKRPESGKAGSAVASKPARGDEEDEDEEEGRSALGNKKRKVTVTADEVSTAGETINSIESAGSKLRVASNGDKKKKAGSYLDEILAERSRKKKKKK